MMLAGSVSKLINNPRNLVVTAERQRIARSLQVWNILVRLVYDAKHVLTPRHQLGPHVDVLPLIWQTVTPRSQRALKLLHGLQTILDICVAGRRIDVRRFLNFNNVLEAAHGLDVTCGDY